MGDEQPTEGKEWPILYPFFFCFTYHLTSGVLRRWSLFVKSPSFSAQHSPLITIKQPVRLYDCLFLHYVLQSGKCSGNFPLSVATGGTELWILPNFNFTGT